MNLRPLGYEPPRCPSHTYRRIPSFPCDLGVRVPDVTRCPMLSVVFRGVWDAFLDAAIFGVLAVAGVSAQ